MEEQFIIRLPEVLKNINIKNAKLNKINQKEVTLVAEDKSYPGIICKLPTIIESQKIVDNKLYKIADISTLVVIFEDNSFNLEQELFKHEASGLTPPMAYVKETRFVKTTVRTEEVERIERKVAELLQADARALKVEIVNEKDSTETEIDLLAAELENELTAKSSHIGEQQLAKKHESIHDITVNTTNKKKAGELDDFNVMETPEAYKKKNDVLDELELIADIKNPELVELEEKIREKQDQFNKAVNPILKKRFEQALETLKAEYEKKKQI
ncbi:hypothetical protein GINT2_001501 [Glugoides intestinalis]